MASTDAKSGFRLPWSTDRNESDEGTGTSGDEPTAMDPADPQSESETPTMIETAPTPSGEAVPDAPAVTPSTAGTAARRPNKFMADLTRAMQAAAEAARADTLERFSSEAKAHIESIHASTADEATELRRKADDDIAAIREWSKAEVARIREETDERVTHRREVLERDVEAHAGGIEARIERVQARVSAFETEMAAFFERLLVEDDPTRFAALAESMPEPPPFDADAEWASTTPIDDVPVADSTTVADEALPAPGDPVAPEYPLESVEGPVADASPIEPTGDETPVDGTPFGDPAPADTGDLFGIAADDQAPLAEGDPRLSAFGIEQDFAAAEAEAAAFPEEIRDPDDEIPTIAEDALAARLAGLVADDHSAAPEAATTRVVVTGLISVASIAGFKRNLARVTGVRSVGVSSGPDGEFVFAVNHDAGLALAEGIATLPGFAARVTHEALGELTVAARDPEADG